MLRKVWYNTFVQKRNSSKFSTMIVFRGEGQVSRKQARNQSVIGTCFPESSRAILTVPGTYCVGYGVQVHPHCTSTRTVLVPVCTARVLVLFEVKLEVSKSKFKIDFVAAMSVPPSLKFSYILVSQYFCLILRHALNQVHFCTGCVLKKNMIPYLTLKPHHCHEGCYF
jgi:hypothetical protein